MNNKKTLIKAGTIITQDEKQNIFQHTDLLITGDQITAIGKNITVDDAEVIDASEMIVMPGLIDTHRHVWESVLRGAAANFSLIEYLQQVLGTLAPAFRAEDVYTANLLGALEALENGITTVMDWSHIMNSPAHADAAINGLKDAGIRAVFGYGTPGTSVWEWFYESPRPHPLDIERILKEHFNSTDQLVTPALAIRGPEYSLFDVAKQDIELARKYELPISMHAGCGTFADKYKAVQQLAIANLLGPDMNFAHCNLLISDDFKLLADNGCSVSVTPEVEMQMGLGFPATGKAIAAGIAPALGVDVVTGVGGDLFTQMRVALQTERSLVNQQSLDAGEMPQTTSLTAADALSWATSNGAKALKLDKKTGSLIPGKQADLILLRTDLLNITPVFGNPVNALVSQCSSANIDSVFVAGKALKRAGKLLHPDLQALRSAAKRTSTYVYEKALIAGIHSG
ncbi:amidohydrolase family protein [Desertivirga xinjiangensis]|uniref:amidohydrolase family protein n=1 Tax=Desertivirga xinjiangensis TaxID=539206 RepID=UPI00210CF6DF|nr:amidohydrolase family protein [Pedobacter xinjiangensis]